MLTPTYFYLMVLVLLFAFYGVFRAQKIKVIANYFAVTGGLLSFSAVLLFFLIKNELPPENRNLSEAINLFYFATITVPEMLSSASLGDEQAPKFNFYDMFACCYIIALLYVFYFICRTSPIEQKSNNGLGNIALAIGLVIVSVSLTITLVEKPNAHFSSTLFQDTQHYIGAIIMPLAVIFFHKWHHEKFGVLWYLIFVCHWPLIIISVNMVKYSINMEVIASMLMLIFYVLWYYFSYGKQRLVLATYLLVFFVFRMGAYFVYSAII